MVGSIAHVIRSVKYPPKTAHKLVKQERIKVSELDTCAQARALPLNSPIM